MNRKRMGGVYVVEFAIIGVLLFTLLFGVLEIGRLSFTVGALNEVVRRGARLAVVCAINDVDIIRQRAIFNNEGGNSSPLIGNLTTANLTLTYLGDDGGVVTSPNDPANLSSIRFVQLSIENFPFTLLIPALLGGEITLPVFRAILPRESLGSDGIGGDTSC